MTKKTLPARIGRSIKPAHSAAAVDRYVPTDWPRIGGNAIAWLPHNAFTTPAFQKAYKPGRRVNQYVAACGESYTSPVLRPACWALPAISSCRSTRSPARSAPIRVIAPTR